MELTNMKNETLSNNFVTEKEGGEGNAGKYEVAGELHQAEIPLFYPKDNNWWHLDVRGRKTVGGTLEAFTRDTNIEGVNNAGRSQGQFRRSVNNRWILTCEFTRDVKSDGFCYSITTELFISAIARNYLINYQVSWSYCSFSAFLSELMLYFIFEYFQSARTLFKNCTWLYKMTKKVVKKLSLSLSLVKA